MLRWRNQIGLFVAAYLVYNLARVIVVGDEATAVANAHWIYDLENDFGFAWEHSVQSALDSSVSARILSNLYLAAQLVVLPGSLIWLYRRSPAIYVKLRNTVLATWMVAVPIYALLPVAPPRLAGIGMTDTVSQQATVAMTGHSTGFYNQFAAVPSLHCGFAVAIAIALAAAARRPATKLMALMWGPAVCLSVVATGNHYIFDIAAGLGVSAVGYGIGLMIERRGDRGPVLEPRTVQAQAV